MKAKKKVRASRSRRIEMLQIYSLMIPVFILIFIFSYIPLYGIVIAFQDYVPGAPFLGEGVKWVGLEHFIDFIQGEYFGRLIRNTLVLSGLNLLFGLPPPSCLPCLWTRSARCALRNWCRRPATCPTLSPRWWWPAW